MIDHVDALRFRSQAEQHELSFLYEGKIRNMGNAGRNGGEYYTPRPLIRAIVRVVRPEIGETIYDGAAGSAGFLCEAYEYLHTKPGLTTTDVRTLQERTLSRSPRTSRTCRTGTATTWSSPTRRSVARSGRRCSRTSRSARARRRSSSCSTSSSG